jgi:anti-anti-sigma regulatory factor
VFKVTSETASGGVVLKLEGRLADAWVDELARAASAAQRSGDEVTFDLGGLTFVDGRGVALLRGVAGRGARLTGGSPFIAALIELERQI